MCDFSGMPRTYRPYLPEQDLLLLPGLRDWLPEDHLAYFVSDLIDELDLRAIEPYYEKEERGYPQHNGSRTAGLSAKPCRFIGRTTQIGRCTENNPCSKISRGVPFEDSVC